MALQLLLQHQQHPLTSTHQKFEINNLPIELYLHILSQISTFSDLLTPSSETLHLPIHLPFSAPLFHNSLLFTFSCIDILRQFSGFFNRGWDVRRVRILYDDSSEVGVVGEKEKEELMRPEEKKKGDWVFVLFECFQMLEEITFVKTMRLRNGECMEEEERWCEDIKCAVREGLSMRGQTGGAVVLKLEDGKGWRREEKIVYT